MKYAVTFTSSATGALAAQTGQVVLRAPLGTTFQTSGVRFVDLSSNASGSGYPNTLSDGGRTLTATVPFDVPAGRQLRVEAVATNTSTVGSQQLEVSTSSDPSIATAGFTLVAASPVSGASVSLTSLAAGASQVKYAVTFTSSATGALAAQTGQVVLRAPLGTTFQTSGVRFVDLSSNASGSGYPNTLSDGGRTLTATVPFDVPAGRQLRVEAVATNTSTVGSQQLEVSTSSDPSIATAGFTLVAASPVSGASVSLTSLAAGASQVKYAVTFTSSATGALAAQTGQVVLRAPLGTTFQTSGVRFVDLSSNASGSGYPNTLSDGGRTLTATVPFDVPAGRQLRVEAVATNTSTVGSQQLEVSTSSDPSIATAGFTLVAASPVSGGTLTLSQARAGALRTDYTIAFRTTAQGRVIGDGQIQA